MFQWGKNARKVRAKYCFFWFFLYFGLDEAKDVTGDALSMIATQNIVSANLKDVDHIVNTY